jgi:hypothetical protein
MDHLARGQNPVPSEGVAQAALGNEIDLPPEDGLQLLDHFHPVEQVQAVTRREFDQHIDVAVRAKVVPQHGAEQG